MSRREDLERYIRQSYEIIRDYEEMIQTSNRPEDKQQAQRAVDRQWGLIEGYLKEYLPLVGDALPSDIREIAAHFMEAQEELRDVLPDYQFAASRDMEEQLLSIRSRLAESQVFPPSGTEVREPQTLSDHISRRKGYWRLLREAAIQAVTVGGVAAMGWYRQTETFDELPWPADLPDQDLRNPSTFADLQATAAILQTMNSHLGPMATRLGCGLSYLGEETQFDEWLRDNLRQDAYDALRTPEEFFTEQEHTIRVVLDAIDGTVNFVHGIPLFCSGLAILVGNHVRVAAIYDPIHHIVYSGVLKGPDDNPEADSEAYALEVATGNQVNLVQLAEKAQRREGQKGALKKGIGVHLTRSKPEMLHEFAGIQDRSGQTQLERLANAFGGIYALNSGMLAMINVARGALGAFVNITTNLWDVAPGEVLIRACKGKVTGFNGRPIDYSCATRISVVAARSPLIHSGILNTLTASS